MLSRKEQLSAIVLFFGTYGNVPEERAVDVPRMVRHPHVVVEVLMVVGLRVISGVMVRPRIEHLVVVHGRLVVPHVRMGVVEEYGVRRRRLRRREVVVVPPQQKVAGRVSRVRVQMGHVAVVGLEVVVLGLRRRHRGRRVLVRRRYRRAAPVVPRRHLYPVLSQMVVARVHKRVDHCPPEAFLARKQSRRRGSDVVKSSRRWFPHAFANQNFTPVLFSKLPRTPVITVPLS